MVHPTWCGRAHVCSADRSGGEHRSHPLTFDAGPATMVATRISTRDGREFMELRVVVALPTDPVKAALQAQRAVQRITDAFVPAVTG